MKKELPIIEPPINYQQLFAYPLSIILTDENKWNWFYNEFIQIYGHLDFDGNGELRIYNYGNYNEYDPLEIIKMFPDNLKFGGDLIKLFELYIDNKYYPYFLCDDYYITTMNIKNHRLHDILIYGYDTEQKVFLAFAYNGYKMQRFFIPYQDFLNAYYSKEIENMSKTTIFYKLKDKNYSIDMEKIKWHLLDYYECVDTLSRERPFVVRNNFGYVWGLDVYDIIEKLFLRDKVIEFTLVTYMYLLWEHKKNMVERIKYLRQHDKLHYSEEILNEFENVRKNAEIILNLSLKLHVQKFNISQSK